MNIKQFAVAAATFAIATGALAADKNDITLKTTFGTAPVQSYSWGATNTASTGSGGAGAGKVVLQDLQFTRTVDAQSPQFLGAVNTGLHLACVQLTDGSLKLTLRDVSVASYVVGGSSGNANKTPAVEQVSLAFTSFAYTVDGVTQGTAAACQ